MPKHSESPQPQNESLKQLVHDIEQRELEKEEKRAARRQKQYEKEQQKKQALREKFVAPILLLLTVVLSVLAWLLSR